MRRAVPLLAAPGAALVAWFLLGGAPSRGAEPAATFVSLLAWQLAALGSLVVGLSLGTGGSRGWMVVLGVWAAHAAVSYVPALVLLDADARRDFILCQAAFHGFVTAAWSLERAMTGSRAGVLALVLGAVALSAPAGLDEWLGRSRDVARTAEVIEEAIAFSPPIAACGAVLEWDLFRQERVYSTYRLGETLHGHPPLRRSAALLCQSASLLLVLAGVLRVMRGVLPSLRRG